MQNEMPDNVPVPEIKARDEQTKTIITLVCKDGRITVRMDCDPVLDPKSLTFDQAAGSVALKAIGDFLNQISEETTNENKN